MFKVKLNASEHLISLKECSEILQKKGYSGLKKYLMVLDILYSYNFFHTNLQEYLFYDFYNQSYKKRKKFLLVYHKKFFSKVNVKLYTTHKIKMYNKLKSFYGREIICTPECGMGAFVEFAKKHKKICIKPESGSCGIGIFNYEYTNENSAISMFINLGNNNFICEEFIAQHPKMQELNAKCVNTVRILTFFDNDKANIVGAVLRMGKSGSCVDNLKSGGIGANIDENTGIINTVGMDYDGNVFPTHPDSGIEILGFQIPHWDRVLDLVNQVSLICKECPILAWDVAIRENDVVLVEANNRPGPMIHQFIDKKPKGEEILKFIKKSSRKTI